MREVNDNPVDPLGTLGHPIKPSPIAKPDTARPFERGNHGRDGKLIADQSKALETIAETLRKKSPRDEQACEFGAYIEAMLGCI